MIGPFPQPLTGMSHVNSKMKEILITNEEELYIINTSPISLDLSLKVRIRRILKIVKYLIHLIILKKNNFKSLYMSVSGGFGQIYELLFLFVTRSINVKILHHHAYSYINNKSILTKFLLSVSGEACTHITQSKKMANDLKKTYSGDHIVIPISNVVYLDDLNINEFIVRKSIKTIGYLSNISKEKGIFDYLSLAKAFKNKELQFIIAGPFQDANIKRQVEEQISFLNNVKYIGPIYSSKKNKFFSSIDLFVFPTHYRNETEGIVNIEAFKRGIPVLAYGRGCIPELINNIAGYCINPSDDFVANSMNKINEWLQHPEKFRSISEQTKKRYDDLIMTNQNKLTYLLEKLS